MPVKSSIILFFIGTSVFLSSFDNGLLFIVGELSSIFFNNGLLFIVASDDDDFGVDGPVDGYGVRGINLFCCIGVEGDDGERGFGLGAPLSISA
ncbi:hypothetical protein Tco_0520104 [Tanacetum coccineum]